jgi:hypothetical protein
VKHVKQADRVFSQIVRSRGACERCFDSYELDCAHIFGRGFWPTRWDEDNALCLCRSCHRRAHDFPDAFMAWVEQRMGTEALDALRLKAHAPSKVDVEGVLTDLRQRLKEIA